MEPHFCSWLLGFFLLVVVAVVVVVVGEMKFSLQIELMRSCFQTYLAVMKSPSREGTRGGGLSNTTVYYSRAPYRLRSRLSPPSKKVYFILYICLFLFSTVVLSFISRDFPFPATLFDGHHLDTIDGPAPWRQRTTRKPPKLTIYFPKSITTFRFSN